MNWKYLHKVSDNVLWMDHRVVPEARAMFAAMMSRVPKGGIEARYHQVVEEIAIELYEAVDGCSWDKIDEDLQVKKVDMYSLAESCLARYPLHPAVQRFFDLFVGKYGHCYDEETEVLVRIGTWVGWLKWKDAINRYRKQDSVEIAAYDPATDSVKFEIPISWIEKEYIGKMYRVEKKNGNVDILVTPEHKMLVKKREHIGGLKYRWSDWHGVKAENIYGKTNYRFKRTASCLYETLNITEKEDPWGLSKIDMNAFGRLCGFFIGDGYAGGKQRGYLSFNIRKDRGQNFLKDVEQSLSLKVLREKSGRCRVHLDKARDWARDNFYSDVELTPSGKPAKQIPSWILQAPKDFVMGFLEGLRNSDGTDITDSSWSYASSSNNVIQGLQILGVLWGVPVSFSRPYTNKQGLKIAFASGQRHAEPVLNRNWSEDEWVDYNGKVYCATVSTGFLVVRRSQTPIISGNSSIMELVGSPTVFVEHISWWFAYLSFDNPLVRGQEMSTRAVWRRDWPMAVDCPKDPDLEEFHNLGLEIAWHETEAWKKVFSVPENRDKYGVSRDKEAFRPAFDRARWALPGTVETGVGHAADLRTMARVIKVMEELAETSKCEEAFNVIGEMKQAYKEALPGMSGMGLREAVYNPARADADGDDPGQGATIPGHLMFESIGVDYDEDGVSCKVHLTSDREQLARSEAYWRSKRKSYVDPFFNQYAQVDVDIQCSLAASRDWHRHRTFFPWRIRVVGSQPILDDHYEPMSDFGKENVEKYMELSCKLYDKYTSQGNRWVAALCMPLGTRVSMRAQGGLRDAIYMAELRGYAHGANFEYKEQAIKIIQSIDENFPGGKIVDVRPYLGLDWEIE